MPGKEGSSEVNTEVENQDVLQEAVANEMLLQEVQPETEDTLTEQEQQQVEDIEDFIQNLDTLGLPVEDNDQGQYHNHLNSVGQSLHRIRNNQEQIDTIRRSLLKVISIISENPSILSKWARAYGNWHLAAKIGTGAAVALSPLFAALFAVSAAAIIASGVLLGGAYTGLALLFEDHNSNEVNNAERLEDGVNALVDMLAAVITELNEVSCELKEGVDGLNKEVTRLQAMVDGLNQVADRLKKSEANLQLEVKNLNEQVAQLKVVGESFEKRSIELENTNKGLEAEVSKLGTYTDELLDGQIQQKNIVEDCRKALTELEAAKGNIETELAKVQKELEIRNQANLDIYMAQKDLMDKSAEELEAERQKFLRSYQRAYSVAEDKFTELNKQITASSKELVDSQKAQEELQTQLTESIDKLSVTEARLAELSKENAIQQAQLKQQIEILTQYNKDIESGKRQVQESLIKATSNEVQPQFVDRPSSLVDNISSFFRSTSQQSGVQKPVIAKVVPNDGISAVIPQAKAEYIEDQETVRHSTNANDSFVL